jgi:hypothetical protein
VSTAVTSNSQAAKEAALAEGCAPAVKHAHVNTVVDNHTATEDEDNEVPLPVPPTDTPVPPPNPPDLVLANLGMGTANLSLQLCATHTLAAPNPPVSKPTLSEPAPAIVRVDPSQSGAPQTSGHPPVTSNPHISARKWPNGSVGCLICLDELDMATEDKDKDKDKDKIFPAPQPHFGPGTSTTMLEVACFGCTSFVLYFLLSLLSHCLIVSLLP